MMSPSEKAKIVLESGSDLLLALLYAPGKSRQTAEPIDGITRLQKLMFLLQQGVGPKQLVNEAIAYGYRPYKMGPFADGLQRDVDDLVAAGIIVTERLEYWIPDDADVSPEVDPDSSARERRVESYRFKLSDLGKEIGGDIWKGLSEKYRDELSAFKKFFNSLTLRQLLLFTYERFPQYTSESTIKRQLGLG